MLKLGETVTGGTITRWLKSVGDHVDADEPLFEVSTDKVDSEVPAPAAGTLSEILVQEGETAEVGTRLAVISDGAGATTTASAAPPQPAPPAQAAAPTPAAPPQSAPTAPAPSVPPPAARPAPSATPPPAARTAPVAPARPAPDETAPIARSEAAAPAAPSTGDETIPFDNIRRRTAEHMVRSKATSPHVYTSIEVDYERVDRARRAEQDDWRVREGFPLTYLPFIVRAFCDMVEEYPSINASVDGENLVIHHDIHVGIAVDLDFKGLIAPVIRSADGKRLRLIAREIHDLATRARSKQLMPDELAGATVTITNPGPWGTYMTLPIINQPQVAILSTDGIRKRPWVVTGPDGEDSLAIRHVGILALTWDHRAFDGAYAAAFLQAMKEEIQGRDWGAELA